ncbi:MAG: hypothetical protein HOD60_11905 [Candidatus Nitrosopelagicus sp.]|nr:hypothetical protein [Candidatus Nitrosopelagicus sp.]
MPYCPECKSVLDYIISNNKAPNDYRIRIYSCKKCTNRKGKNTLIAITKRLVSDVQTWNIISVDIFENPKI